MHHKFFYNKMGISLLEILVVLLLISLLASFAIPTFITKQRDYVKKQFITEFTTLMQNALYESILTKKIHQIYFDIDHRHIMLKVKDESVQADNKHKKFKSVYPTSSDIIIPENLNIKNFFINNEDEFAAHKKTHEVWFYIMPDGTSQSVIINLEYFDTNNNNTKQFSLFINCFYSQVYQYDTFQKP